MEYISVAEAAKKWKIGVRRVQFYCANGKIQGAKYMGRQWIIPLTAERPTDNRKKNAKQHVMGDRYHFPMLIHSAFFSSHRDATDMEMVLLKAQLYFLEGKFFESINMCRYLIKNETEPYLLFGAYSTIAFSSVFFGQVSDIEDSFEQMNYIIAEEKIHNEDYRLIFAAINFIIDWKCDATEKIQIENLSYEAIPYYESLLLMHTVVKNHEIKEIAYQLIRSNTKLYHVEGIETSSIILCFAAVIYASNFNDVDKINYYIKLACDLSIHNNWTSFFSTFYPLIKEPADEYLNKTNPAFLAKVKQQGEINYKNWKIVGRMLYGKQPFSLFTNNEDIQILILLSYNLNNSQIANIRKTTEDKINEKIKSFLKIINAKTREELVDYAKRQISEQEASY